MQIKAMAGNCDGEGGSWGPLTSQLLAFAFRYYIWLIIFSMDSFTNYVYNEIGDNYILREV